MDRGESGCVRMVKCLMGEMWRGRVCRCVVNLERRGNRVIKVSS